MPHSQARPGLVIPPGKSSLGPDMEVHVAGSGSADISAWWLHHGWECDPWQQNLHLHFFIPHLLAKALVVWQVLSPVSQSECVVQVREKRLHTCVCLVQISILAA